ncbi:MAG: sensor histidine kinase, partial [Desulfobulbaceae bacterium]
MTAIINSAGLLRFFCTISLIFQFFICQAAVAEIVEDRTVRVGIYENEPKVFTSEAGKPAGIFIDIIEFIAKSEGWKIKYVPGTWNEGLERLAKGEIDLMPDVAHTAEREKIYSFHQESVLSSWSQVYGKEGSDIQSILDLANKRIATLQGSIQQEAFARLSEGFDLKITLIPVRDYKSAFAMVANDEADAAICNNFFGLMHIKE